MSLTTTYTPDSPAAALRRFWLGQNTAADTATLQGYLDATTTMPAREPALIPAATLDAEVRKHYGCGERCSAAAVLEAIYPAGVPTFDYAAALALDVLTGGEGRWADACDEERRWDPDHIDTADQQEVEA